MKLEPIIFVQVFYETLEKYHKQTHLIILAISL